MIATPAPAAIAPVGPPTATTVAPPTPGQAAEQPPGGFARMLDQAREEPAQATATPGSATENDKPTAPRASRSGPARLPVASPGESGAAKLPAAEAGTGLHVPETAVSEELATPADGVSQPPATTDAAALLAALAALGRPQTAGQTPAGGTTRTRGDQDPAAADAGGTSALARPATTPPQAAQFGLAGTDKSDPKTGDALSTAGAGRAAAADVQAGREAAADAGSRSFAAELQAVLPPATSAAMAGQATTTNQSGPTAGPAGAQGQIAASPGSAAFAPELGATLATFVREGVQHARLELHPAEMGPVSVQIQLDGLAAQVHLSAQNADTRQALEQAMPQLAGSLREAGLTLSGGGVFEQPRQAPSDDPSDRGGRRHPGGQDGEQAGDAAGAQASHTAAPARRRGVVDLVA